MTKSKKKGSVPGFNISTIVTSKVGLGKCALVNSSCCGEDEMTKYIQIHEKF